MSHFYVLKMIHTSGFASAILDFNSIFWDWMVKIKDKFWFKVFILFDLNLKLSVSEIYTFWDANSQINLMACFLTVEGTEVGNFLVEIIVWIISESLNSNFLRLGQVKKKNSTNNLSHIYLTVCFRGELVIFHGLMSEYFVQLIN